MCINDTDQVYMRQAIDLARKGTGWVNPNPLVGAVVVKDGRVIGQGWHRRFGDLHAEREAFASLSDDACGATLYVTLEPCCHHGKQPPCTEAIVQHGISRVVVGSADPNPLVAGHGIDYLRSKGVDVVTDCLRHECDQLNLAFFHYISTGTPYVRLKYAVTADGKTATRTGASRWITGEAARERVHHMRHENRGIMVGIGTVLADDPMLNCRLPQSRQPVRIVVDSKLRIPADSQLVRSASEQPLIVACALANQREGEIETPTHLPAVVRVLNFPNYGQVDLCKLMRYLGSEGIDSILLEGGAVLAEAALRSGLVHEVHTMIAPKIFGGVAKSPVEGLGVALPSDAYPLQMQAIENLGSDLYITYKVDTCLQG